MDASINNPAGRLHDFLSYCWNNGGARPLHTTWGSYLVGEEHFEVDYATAIAELSALPNQIRSAVEGLPRNQATPTAFLLAQIPKLQSVLFFGLLNQTGQTTSFNAQYDQGDLARLEMTSEILGGLAPKGVTANVLGEIKRLGAEIAKLLAEDDSLEPDVRDLLFDLSDGIRRIVASYGVRGPESIARERDLLVGRLVNNPQLAARLFGHKEARHLVRDTVLAATVALTFFNTTADAAENAPKMIEHVEKVAEWLAPVGDALHQSTKQIAPPDKS
jgi:hypothetical protein